MPKMRILSDADRKLLDQQLQTYLSKSLVEGPLESLDYEIEAYLLAEMTHKFFPRMNGPEASNLLFATIRELRASRKESLGIQDVFAEIDKKLDKSGADTFTMLAFLNTSASSCPSQVRVAGSTFKKLKWLEVPGMLRDEKGNLMVDVAEHGAYKNLIRMTCYSYEVVIPKYRSEDFAGIMPDLVLPFERLSLFSTHLHEVTKQSAG